MAEFRMIQGRILGFLLLLLVVTLWVSSSTLIQTIFIDQDFNKPYFLTYFSTSFFSLYLVKLVYKWKSFPDPYNYTKSIAKVAIQFCFLWFGANFFFNMSLDRTSVSSSTILSSTSGIMTLILSIIFLKETPDVLKFIAVSLSFGGIALISIGDKKNGQEGMIGDVYAFIGAFFYGCYSVFLKKKASQLDQVIFFGLVGILNILIFFPGILLFNYVSIEKFELPNKTQLWMLTLNAIVGTMISDLIWAITVKLLNPSLCTVGISLTIPLSIVVDSFFHHLKYKMIFWIGTVLIVSGFSIMCVFEHPTLNYYLTNKYLRQRYFTKQSQTNNGSDDELKTFVQNQVNESSST